METTTIPSFCNFVNISELCLADRNNFIERYFEELYFTVTILESAFDRYNVPEDTDSSSNVVTKSNNIASENQHQDKILTSEQQIKEKRNLVNDKIISDYKSKKHYDSEQHDIKANKLCAAKFVGFVLETAPDLHIPVLIKT